MPKLNCTVESCKYQSSGFCSADAIDVDNSNISVNETMCSTYICTELPENKSSHHISSDISVHCNVYDCVHNNNDQCNAKHIIIGKYGNGVVCHDTECESFLLK